MSETKPSNIAMMQAIVTTTVPVSMRDPFSHLVSGHRSDRQPFTLTHYELTWYSRTASPKTAMNNRRLISTDSNMGISFLSTKELSVKERDKGEYDADHSRRKELRRGSCRKPLRIVVTGQHQDQEHHGHAWKNELTYGNILSTDCGTRR